MADLACWYKTQLPSDTLLEFNNDMNDIRSYLHNTRIIRTHEFIDNIETYNYFKDIEGDVVIYSEYNNNYYNIRH